MNTNQNEITCIDQKLEDVADAMLIIKDAIKTGNEDVIKGSINALKDNPDLPFHFIVSALELKQDKHCAN